MRKIVAALSMTAAMAACFGQPTQVQWTKTFSALSKTGGYCVVQTSDGGYIAAGSTSPDTGDCELYYVVKTDSLGNAEWQRTDGWAYKSSAKSVVQTRDGGYALTGYAVPPGAADPSGAYLVRLGSQGNVEWQRIIDTLVGDGYSVLQTDNGGYVVAGLSLSGVDLVRTDSLGATLWTKEYRLSWYPAENIPLRQTADNGFIIGAKTLIKVDSLGNQQWAKTFDSVYAAYSVAQMSDKGYAATGFLRSGSIHPRSDMYLLRTDSLGNLQWKKTYGSSPRGSLGYWVEPAASGGLVATGYVASDAGASGYIVRTSSTGSEIWHVVLESASGSASAQCIRRTSDGGYIITGCGAGGLVLTKLRPDLGK
jgi:hypothetical protein